MEETGKLLDDLRCLSGAGCRESESAHLTKWSRRFRPIWVIYTWIIDYLTNFCTFKNNESQLNYRMYCMFKRFSGKYSHSCPYHIYLIYLIIMYVSVKIGAIFILRVNLYLVAESWKLDVIEGSQRTQNCALPEDIIDPNPGKSRWLHRLSQWSYKLGMTLAPDNDVLLIVLCTCAIHYLLATIHWIVFGNRSFSLRGLQFMMDPGQVLHDKDVSIKNLHRQTINESESATRTSRLAHCGCRKVEREILKQFIMLKSKINPSDIRPRSLGPKAFWIYLFIGLYAPINSYGDHLKDRRTFFEAFHSRDLSIRQARSNAILSCSEWHENGTIIRDPLKMMEYEEIEHDELNRLHYLNFRETQSNPIIYNSLASYGLRECLAIDYWIPITSSLFASFIFISTIEHMIWSNQIIKQMRLCSQMLLVVMSKRQYTRSKESLDNIQEALIITYMNIKLFLIDAEPRRMFHQLIFFGCPVWLVALTGIATVLNADGSQQATAFLDFGFKRCLFGFYLTTSIQMSMVSRYRSMFAQVNRVNGYLPIIGLHETIIGRQFRRLTMDDPDVEFRFGVTCWGLEMNAELARSINSTFVGAFICILMANHHHQQQLQQQMA